MGATNPHEAPLQRFTSRDRLLDAAQSLFAKSEYDQASTSAIARAAGSSESQIMKRFANKTGLLVALLEAWVGDNHCFP